jgi:beta-glucosidase
VTVALLSESDREARGVVQFYLSGPRDDDGGYDRPARWFVGHASADIPPGRVVALTLNVPRRAFEVWSAEAHAWVLPSGEYTLQAALNARDEGTTVALTV